jgi:hypothetical protein
LKWLFIGFGVIAVLVAALFLYLAWYWWGGGLIWVGIIMALVGRSMPSRGRLVIGETCLQEIEGDKTVVLHLPFDNIEDIGLAEGRPGFVGINLVALDDPGSYAKAGFVKMKESTGYDYTILDQYRESPKEVYSRIVKKFNRRRAVE